MSSFYDLLDVIYFRKYETSPRKVVNELISDNDKILDLCTGTGANAVNIAKRNTSVKVVGVDISKDMLIIAKSKVKQEKLSNIKLCEVIRVLKPNGEIIITEWERSKELVKKIVFFPIEVLEPKSYKSFIVKDLYAYFADFGLEVVEEKHCDYSKVLRLKKKN